MANKTINDFTPISSLALGDKLIVWDSDASVTNNVTIQKIVDLVSVGAQNPVDASNVAAAGALMNSYFTGGTGFVKRNNSTSYTEVTTISASEVSGLGSLATAPASIASAATSTYLMYNGSQWVPVSITSGGGGGGHETVTASAVASVGGILDSQFSGLGYVQKTGTQSFTGSVTIPASDITGLGVLATTSTQASAISFLNLGELAQVSTATSGRTFLGFTAYGATLVSAANAAAAGTLLNLGTLATTSTAASARSFISQSLSTLTDVSVGTPSTNTFLRYNGTQWTPSSVATGGTPAFAGSFFTLDPGNPAITNAAVTLRAAVSVVNTSNAYSTVNGRFTPGVAGYYECNMRLQHSCVTSVNRILTFEFWKNGTAPSSPYDFGAVQVLTAPVAGQADTVNVQNVFFLNGSTDFVVPIASGTDAVSKSVSMGYVYFRYLGA